MSNKELMTIFKEAVQETTEEMKHEFKSTFKEALKETLDEFHNEMSHCCSDRELKALRDWVVADKVPIDESGWIADDVIRRVVKDLVKERGFD